MNPKCSNDLLLVHLGCITGKFNGLSVTVTDGMQNFMNMSEKIIWKENKTRLEEKVSGKHNSELWRTNSIFILFITKRVTYEIRFL